MKKNLLIGFATLFLKEIRRFWKVGVQTIAAPVLSVLLYVLIFGHVVIDHGSLYQDVAYTSFLLPGLMMMSMMQNAFANSSSSLIQSKITGNLVFILLSPLSHIEIFSAYVLASIIRGLCIGLSVWATVTYFIPLPVAEPFWALSFAFLGAGVLGTMGLIAGIWAEKFDQIAAFQNFLIMPATFLAGVFYSTEGLPEIWQMVSRINPFFYMVDGFRYGFFGLSDIDPKLSVTIVAGAFFFLSYLALSMLKSGYKLKH